VGSAASSAPSAASQSMTSTLGWGGGVCTEVAELELVEGFRV
jgi:hypothetical protein